MPEMDIINFKNIKPIQMLPGIFRHTLVHNENLMLVYFDLRKDADLPLHSHPHTQMGYIVKGTLDFHIYGTQYRLKAGDSYHAPSNVEHGAKVIEDCIIIDVFNPAREDYI
ncbi:MAG TPA: cupin domain-containing protein [Candidatus Deferrimicrobium sp.]|nr:cupin domain-containing protein [Candidatus Deferrimicrobium sp.]